MNRVLAFLLLVLAIDATAATPDLVQNAHGRAGIDLDGAWSRIVDPFENGYYDYRKYWYHEFFHSVISFLVTS